MRSRRVANSALVCIVLIALLGCTGSDRHTERPRSSSSTTSASKVSAPPGTRFVDPRGTYSITVAPDWTRLTGTVVASAEAWQVAPRASGFAANVNVLTQAAPGATVKSYTALSIRALKAAGGTLMDSGIRTGPDGTELGYMDYVATFGTRRLHCLGVFGIRNGDALVATLTTLPPDFAELRSTVEPYLFTLGPP